MMHGKVLRPPSFGATLASLDAREATAMPGVVVVRDGDFVGVVARGTLVASKALKAIKAEWTAKPTKASSKDLFDHWKGSGGGRGADRAGASKAGREAADVRLEGTYTVAYIAHAPLEPRAA